MKVIDLLNKISKGKKYKAIKYKNQTFDYSESADAYFNVYGELFEDYILLDELNCEVEIIEEHI
jgi:hypothetical protein